MNLGFIRQYLGEVPPDRTFTAKELWEVFNAFAPLMTKEQEKKMVDNLKNLLETHTVKEGGYENEPCYQRECSNPSKHTNGLHIGSEREVKEEPTTPEKKCVGEGRHCFTHNQARIFCAIDRVEDRIGRTEKKCGDCEEWREFKEWYAKTKEWGGDYSEWEKLKTTEAKSICP